MKFHRLFKETMEKEFEIDQTGNYKLIIQSNSNEGTGFERVVHYLMQAKNL